MCIGSFKLKLFPRSPSPIHKNKKKIKYETTLTVSEFCIMASIIRMKNVM